MRQMTPAQYRRGRSQPQEFPDHLRCCARLKFSWIVRCSRRSKVDRAGFGFCGIHDPGPDVTPDQAANLSAIEQPPRAPRIGGGGKREMARLTPADIEAAIRVGCVAADVYLTCSYPDCTCTQLPAAIRAALTHAELVERGPMIEAEEAPLHRSGFR